MNRLFVFAACQIVKVLCADKHKRFFTSLERPSAAQELLRRKIVADLSKTDYGKSLGIGGSETYEQFASKVPIVDYDMLESLVVKQIESGRSTLTPHHIVHVEPTSGSSGAAKKIPYTKPLLQSFSNMFAIWAYDLLSHGLNLKTGKIFLSISPVLQEAAFANDLSYLEGPLGLLLSPFIVSPKGRLGADNYQQKLAETILREEKLEVISIWSPSYLLTILSFIEGHRSEMAKLLSPERESLLLSEPINWQKLFPHLQLISCWDSAHSATVALQLTALFPDVRIQGKGLLATETPITIPLTGVVDGVPLVDDVFLEFESAEGAVTRLHELDEGKAYQLIISQRAGLYRYRLNDLVMVCAVYLDTATLKFLGRANLVCDMVGEKLHESFVRAAMNKLGVTTDYILLPVAASASLGPARYVMLTETRAPETVAAQAKRFDQVLSSGFHYEQARQLGQLASLEIIVISQLRTKLQQFHQIEGMKLGDIKDTALVTDLAKAKRLLQFVAVNSKSLESSQQPLQKLAV